MIAYCLIFIVGSSLYDTFLSKAKKAYSGIIEVNLFKNTLALLLGVCLILYIYECVKTSKNSLLIGAGICVLLFFAPYAMYLPINFNMRLIYTLINFSDIATLSLGAFLVAYIILVIRGGHRRIVKN